MLLLTRWVSGKEAVKLFNSVNVALLPKSLKQHLKGLIIGRRVTLIIHFFRLILFYDYFVTLF